MTSPSPSSQSSSSSGFLTAHLDEVGETYFEHMGIALRIGIHMLVGGLACLVHGLLPFLFIRTGSDTIKRLGDFIERRRLHGGTN